MKVFIISLSFLTSFPSILHLFPPLLLPSPSFLLAPSTPPLFSPLLPLLPSLLSPSPIPPSPSPPSLPSIGDSPLKTSSHGDDNVSPSHHRFTIANEVSPQPHGGSRPRLPSPPPLRYIYTHNLYIYELLVGTAVNFQSSFVEQKSFSVSLLEKQELSFGFLPLSFPLSCEETNRALSCKAVNKVEPGNVISRGCLIAPLPFSPLSGGQQPQVILLPLHVFLPSQPADDPSCRERERMAPKMLTPHCLSCPLKTCKTIVIGHALTCVFVLPLPPLLPV